jgi:hypothetical protein
MDPNHRFGPRRAVTRMQTPVRYYITQSDDHAVVRSVPVSVRLEVPAGDIRATPSPEPELGHTMEAGPRRARVTRLVRAAARRAELQR